MGPTEIADEAAKALERRKAVRASLLALLRYFEPNVTSRVQALQLSEGSTPAQDVIDDLKYHARIVALSVEVLYGEIQHHHTQRALAAKLAAETRATPSKRGDE